MTLQRAKNLVHVRLKNIFLSLICISDMDIQMCNIDNFDIDQMSSKFAQK